MYNKLAQTASFLLAFIFLAPDLLASARATELIVQSFYEPYSTSKSRGILLPQPAVNDIYRTEGDHTPADYRTSEDVTKNRKVSGPAAAIFMLRAEEEVAYLGDHPADPMHLPANDVFNIRIEPSQLQKEVYAYLTYRISGLEDGLSLPKSINGAPAFVSSRPQKKEGWQKVTHTISTSLLKAGMNKIRFNAPHNLKASVEVRDVEITLSTQISNSPALSQVARPEASSEDFKASMDSLPLSALSVQDVDMPAIPRNITNVTANSWGYLVPQGAGQPIRVKLGVNRLKVPAGTSLSEVRLFFFDQVSQSWQATHVEHIDMATASLEAQGPGGTNYFAGLIKTPEMPEASAFMPTAISGIKAANPAAEMNIMQPPSISQTGEAGINYPLVIPAGRQGMQPNINLTYSSDAGTGWLGVGWNINVPNVSIDSRWGVPTFPDNVQQEDYTLKGQALIMEGGYRGSKNPGNRVSDEAYDGIRFFERTMSSYKEIIRHGDDPSNYYWEEITADQTHYFYGAADQQNVSQSDAIMTNNDGDIIKWYLKKVVDKWGNFMTYHYSNPDYSSAIDLKKNGKAVVLEKIQYTGHPTTDDGKYTIEFTSAGGRQDATVSLKLGVKEVDDRHLSSITVMYDKNGTDEKEVKRFEFELADGGFGVHKLLKSVKEFRSNDPTPFYQHDFEYHSGALSFNSTPQTIEVESYNQGLFDELPEGIKDLISPMSDLVFSSPLKTTITSGWGGGGSIGLGMAPLTFPFPSKTFTFTGRYGFAFTNNHDKTSLDDLNGDGIPDIIYDQGSKKRYLPINLDENANLKLKGFRKINVKGNLMESSSNSISYGFGFTLPANLYYYGRNWNTTNSEVSRYLTDFNVDGIKDLVLTSGLKDVVLFGQLDEKNEITFNSSSESTPNPVYRGTALFENGLPEPEPLKDLEVVRTWEAPFDGVVNISGDATISELSEDNAFISIQKNNAFEVSMAAVTSPSNAVDMSKNNVTVNKGDLFLFRTQANQNGYGDFVSWNPGITYISGAKTDGNGTSFSQSSYQEGFLLSAREAVSFSGAQAVKVTWPTFTVSSLSDDVTLRINVMVEDLSSHAIVSNTKYDYKIYHSSTQTPPPAGFIEPGQSSAPSFMNVLSQVPGAQAGYLCYMTFEVLSTSNVDWKEIKWRPEVQFGPKCGSANRSTYPAVQYLTYNKVLEIKDPYVSSASGGTSLVAWPSFNTTNFQSGFMTEELGHGNSYPVYMVVKGTNRTLSKIYLEVHENSIDFYKVPEVLGETPTTPLTLNGAAISQNFLASALNNGEMYIEFFGPNERITEVVANHASINIYQVLDDEPNTEEFVTTGLFSSFYTEFNELQDYYLGWGQFCWSNNSDEDYNFIDIADLHLDRSLAENNDFSDGEAPTTEEMQENTQLNAMDPMSQKFLMMQATRGEKEIRFIPEIAEVYGNDYENLDRWTALGTDVGAYSEAGATAPGKFGEPLRKVPSIPNLTLGTYSAYGLVQRSKSFTLAESAGPSIPGTGISFVSSSTIDDKPEKYFTESLTSFMDINGDGYPDILYANDGINSMVTDPRGGHTSLQLNWASGMLTKSITKNSANVVSGTYVNEDARFTNTSAGASGGIGTTRSIIEWMDFNGDGLADRLTEGANSSINLELNRGNGLEGPLNISPLGVSKAENQSLSIDASISALENQESGLGYSFSAGVGINRSGSESQRMFLDVSGDGLSDMITQSSGQLNLYLNTGTGFQYNSSANLAQLTALSNSNSLGLSGQIAGSYAFPVFSIVFAHLKISVSGNLQANYAVNKLGSTFRDMNGDGAIDYIQNDGGNLKVYFSEVGKNNLLKKVSLPLGGSFEIDYEKMGNRYGDYPVEVKIHTTLPNERIIWDMPNGKWVMKTLTINDGLDIQDNNSVDLDGDDVLEYTFNYDGGIKSRREREFLGFTRIETKYKTNREELNVKHTAIEKNKWWISEVTDYFRPNKNETQYRKRFEYLKGLIKNSYVLVHEGWTEEQNVDEQVPVYKIHPKDVTHNHYAFLKVGNNDPTNTSNFNQVAVDANDDFIPVAWGGVTESQTIFPALVAIDRFSDPVVNNQINPTSKHFGHYDLKYDNYFNVIEYVDGGTTQDVTVTTQVVDVINSVRFEYDERTYSKNQVENGASPFDNPISVDPFTGEKCFSISDNGFTSDTICIPDHLTNPPATPCWNNPTPRSDQFTITLRKKIEETINIEEEVFSATLNAAMVAKMQYFEPAGANGAAGQTNVLKQHEIYLNSDAPANLKRKSTAVMGNNHQKAPEILYQHLFDGSTAQTNLTYDDLGNVTQVIGPANHQAQRMETNLTYDDEVYQFVTYVNNSYLDNACFTYDYSSGKLLKTVDINGYATGYKYDKNYRLVEVYAPNTFYSNEYAPTIAFEYYPGGIAPGDPNDPNYEYQQNVPVAFTYHNINPRTTIADQPLSCWSGPGGAASTACDQICDFSGRPSMINPLETATFMDGMQRVVQVKKKASMGTGDHREVSGIQAYDYLGRQVESRLSFSEASSSILGKLANVNSMVINTKEYDYASRVKKDLTLNSNNSFTTTIFNYDWHSLNSNDYYSVRTARAGVVTNDILNARGQKIASNIFTIGMTSFEYNALNELLNCTDPLGETTTYTYDNFGRLRTETHPDRGVSNFTYDPAGNLRKIETDEIKPYFIRLDYHYNRLTHKLYPNTNNLNETFYTYGNRNDGNNGAGRVTTVGQGTNFKTENYKYDVLGNRIYEKKTLAVPKAGTLEFTTQFEYDSWGRIQSMDYPDGEHVNYTYGDAGELEGINPTLPSPSPAPDNPIIDKILYDGFGNIKTIEYGNNTVTNFTYNAYNRTLETQKLDVLNGASQSATLLDKDFSYDARGNVSGVVNNTSTAVSAGGVDFGGPYDHTYNYDAANRLNQSVSNYGVPQNGNQKFLQLDLTYNEAGGIVTKKQLHKDEQGNFLPAHTYDLRYTYKSAHSHQLDRVKYHYVYNPPSNKDIGDFTGEVTTFIYNDEGSITRPLSSISGTVTLQENIRRDEEQQITAVRNDKGVHHYVYDHNGERILKTTLYEYGTAQNGQGQGTSADMAPYAVYVNPYYVATHYLQVAEVSKHYYMGSQRVASALINYPFTASAGTGGGGGGPEPPEGSSGPLNAILQDLQDALEAFNQEYAVEELDIADIEDYDTQANYQSMSANCPPGDDQCLCEISWYWAEKANVDCSQERIMYWYHPDYLGHTEAITNQAGQPYQYFLFSAFGETIEQQHSTLGSYSSPYRFNGKEYDQETGNYYYGARYYDPKLSIWLSVDPMSSERPSLTPYNFVSNNPIMRTDPTGLLDGDFFDENDNLIGSDGINDGKIYVINTSETSFKNGSDVIPGAGQSEKTSTDAMNFVSLNNGDTKAFNNNPDVYDKFTELPGDSKLRQSAMNYADANNTVETATISVSQNGHTITNQGMGTQTSGGANVQVAGMQLINDPNYTINLDFHSHQPSLTTGQPLSQPPSLGDLNTGLINGNSAVYGIGSQKVYLHNNKQVNAVVHPNTFKR